MSKISLIFNSLKCPIELVSTFRATCPFKASVVPRGCRALKMLVHLEVVCCVCAVKCMAFKTKNTTRQRRKNYLNFVLCRHLYYQSWMHICAGIASNRHLQMLHVNPSFVKINVSSARNLNYFAVAVA